MSLISGQYLRNYELTDVVKPSASATGSVKPFWEEYPTIGNARPRHINLKVEKFEVKNNIASPIALHGQRGDQRHAARPAA